MTRSYVFYLQDIVDAIADIDQYIAGMAEAQFLTDRKTQDAVVWRISVIGEATKHIPARIRKKYKQVPWSKMARMRDKITHAYFGIRHEIVWKVCQENLPPIQPVLRNMLQELQGTPRRTKIPGSVACLL
jgi:uncharacterized protein with HEPN domain